MHWYADTDPMTTALVACGLLAACCWVASIASGNYSQVDRLWSILPAAYATHFAAHAGFGDARLDLMAALAVLWGARLTWNYARKGGYRRGSEDYRWPEVRRRLGNWEAIERLLDELVNQQQFVECLYFYDGKGGQVALVVNRQIIGDRGVPAAVRSGEGFNERPWYKAAVQEKYPVLTPQFVSLLSEQLIFTAATPIYEKGELAGVLGIDVNLDSWSKI